jgi:hypothetical protein
MNVIELQGVSKSYGRIAWYAIGDDDGNLPLHIAWLLGTALVFGALAIAGDWRDQGKPYEEDTRL